MAISHIIIVKDHSHLHFLHHLTLILIDFIHNQFSHIMLTHICTNMSSIFILWIHQICQYSMINCIWLSSFNYRLFILKLYLWWVYFKLLHTIFQCWIVITLSSHTNHCLIKIFCKLFNFLWAVSIRVYWHKYWLNVKIFSLWWFSDFLQCFSKFH